MSTTYSMRILSIIMKEIQVERLDEVKNFKEQKDFKEICIILWKNWKDHAELNLKNWKTSDSKISLFRNSSNHSTFTIRKIVLNHEISVKSAKNLSSYNILFNDYFLYLTLKLCSSTERVKNWSADFDTVRYVQMIRIFAEEAVKIKYENKIYYIIIKTYYVLCDKKTVQYFKWLFWSSKNVSDEIRFKIIYERVLVFSNMHELKDQNLIWRYYDKNKK